MVNNAKVNLVSLGKSLFTSDCNNRECDELCYQHSYKTGKNYAFGIHIFSKDDSSWEYYCVSKKVHLPVLSTGCTRMCYILDLLLLGQLFKGFNFDLLL